MEPRRPLPAPPPPPEPPPFRSRVLAVLSALLVVGLVAGVIYFFKKGADGPLAREVMLESGLRQSGLSLWTTGNAPGMRSFDDDLVKTIGALRNQYAGLPEIVVSPVSGEPGERTGTHQINFGAGGPPFLTVTVNVDLTMGTADILSHSTPESVNLDPDAALDPAEKLLRDFGKRRAAPETPAETSASPESPAALPDPVLSAPVDPAPAAEEAVPAPPPVPEKVSEEQRKGDE